MFMGVSNYCLFFLNGLPGGIDYYMMYLVEGNKLDKISEKHYNAYLNTWIRAPGILYGAFYSYQQHLCGNLCLLHAIPVVMILTWNAQYYSSLVSWSYGYHLHRPEGKGSLAADTK